MKVRRTVNLTLWIMLATALFAGCASSPPSPPKPITEIRQIEGKWRGTISFDAGPEQFYYLTIHPGGSLVAQWGMNWQWGKVTLSGGVASFEISGTSNGTLQYYDGPGGRSLTLNPEFGGWSAQVTPLD